MAQAEHKNTQTGRPSHPLSFPQLVAAYYAAYDAAESAEEDSRQHVRALRRWQAFRDHISRHSPADLTELREKVRVLAHYAWPGPDGPSVSPKPLAVVWRDLERLVA